ncbi:hypothetical protein QQZ08_010597 [Neonectria magnoliae]|uniref:Uncharacterized protein n=1 Tax=Neonectria magnoliae TaxID=2732573 RepID=A0ABR1HFN6_9HYPO
MVSFCDRNFRDVSWDELDGHTQAAFTQMTPDARRLMDIHWGRVYLFVGRIWRIIDEAIFQKTNTHSVQWESPYFKHQHEMLKELRKSNPGAPHSHLTRKWREWDYLSFYLFQGTADAPPRGRIRLACFYQILADGIGPLFPKVLCSTSSEQVRSIGYFFIQREQDLSYCQDYHYFLFAHPGTLETSGFEFRSILTVSQAMKGIDMEYGRFDIDSFHTHTTFEGQRVDLIVAPMLMTVYFTRPPPEFSRIPFVNLPMLVCAGWIEELDRMEDDEGESNDGVSKETEPSQTGSGRTETEPAKIKTEPARTRSAKTKTEPGKGKGKKPSKRGRRRK